MVEDFAIFCNIKSIIKKALVVALVSTLAACAAPATKTIPISDAELRQERQTQSNMARVYKPKPVVRKHKELSFYEDRLKRVSAPLMQAAKKLSKENHKNYAFKVVDQEGLNAWTDGKSVTFTPVMIDFLETDKELAVVIAHELSHNIMQHHSKQKQNTIVGAVLDIAAATQGINTNGMFSGIGSMSYSQGFENEADYVAVYVMALAGYDISNVHQIWRKMTIQTGSGTKASFFSSHPSNPERFIRMQRTIEEVKAKQKAGKKLEPNLHV